MAVAQPRQTNLSPAFANIQRGLERRQELEVEKERNKPINVAARDVKSIFDRVFEAQLTNFVSTLGKDKFTSKDAEALIKETEASGKARSLIRNHIGVRSTPKEREDFMGRFQDQLSIDLHKKNLLDTRSFTEEQKLLIGQAKSEDIPGILKQMGEDEQLKQQQEAVTSGDPSQVRGAFPELAAKADLGKTETPKATEQEKAQIAIDKKTVNDFTRGFEDSSEEELQVELSKAQAAIGRLGGEFQRDRNIKFPEPARERNLLLLRPAKERQPATFQETGEFIARFKDKVSGDKLTKEERNEIVAFVTGGEIRNLTPEEKVRAENIADELGINRTQFKK